MLTKSENNSVVNRGEKKEFISAHEAEMLAKNCGLKLSYKTIINKIKTKTFDGYYGKSSKGQKSWLVNLTSLPIEVQEKYQQEENQSLLTEPLNEILSLFKSDALVKKENDSITPRREIVTIKQQSEIDLKLAILNHYNAAIAEAKFGTLLQIKEDFVKWFNSGIILTEQRKVFGKLVRYKTLDEWNEKLKSSNNDVTVLLRKSKPFKPIVPEVHLIIFGGLYAHPNRPKVEESVDHALEFLKANNQQINYSKVTFRRYCTNFYYQHKPMIDAAREGKKGFSDNEAPNVLRDNDLLTPGQELSWDGKQLDFLINGNRKTLLLSKDVGSTIICGYVLADSETIESILLLTYRSIMFLQKRPLVIRPDNGAAFRSKEVQETMRVLGIYYKFVGIRNAKAKSVERTNQTIEKFERYFPTYIGTSIKNKPAHFNQGEFEAKKLHNQLYNGLEITSEIANDAIAKFVDLYNNQIIKSGKHKGRKRIDVFNEGKGSGVNPLELTYLMMKKLIKRSNKNGININGEYYYNVKLFGQRKSYLIRYDRVYDNPIYVFDVKTGEFLFEAFKRSKADPQALIFGDENSAREVFKQIQLGKQLVKHTYHNLSIFHEKVVKPMNDFLLHKIGIGVNKTQKNIDDKANNNNLIDAEIIDEIDNKILLKTGTDDIENITVANNDKSVSNDKKNNWLYRRINKR